MLLLLKYQNSYSSQLCLHRMIQNESRYPNGGNVYYVTMQITFLTCKFRNVERKLHCDVVHNTTVWVSSLIVRKTDSTFNKGKDIVVCLPGARIEHVTERVQRIMGRGNGRTIPFTSGQTTQTRRAQQR